MLMPQGVTDDTIPIEEAVLRVQNSMKERELQAIVKQMAELCGWEYYHTYDSRRSNPGFPDVVMLRGERMIVAELKVQKGKVSEHQERWLKKFDKAGSEAYLWRPSDLREIEELLR